MGDVRRWGDGTAPDGRWRWQKDTCRPGPSLSWRHEHPWWWFEDVVVVTQKTEVKGLVLGPRSRVDAPRCPWGDPIPDRRRRYGVVACRAGDRDRRGTGHHIPVPGSQRRQLNRYGA